MIEKKKRILRIRIESFDLRSNLKNRPAQVGLFFFYMISGEILRILKVINKTILRIVIIYEIKIRHSYRLDNIEYGGE